MLSEWPKNWVLLQSEPQALKGLWMVWNPEDGAIPSSNPFDSEPRSMSFQPENLPPVPVMEDVAEIDDSTQPRIPNPFVNEETAAPFELAELPNLPNEETAPARIPAAASVSVKSQNPAPIPASLRDDQTPPPAVPLPTVAEKKTAPTRKTSQNSGEFNPDEFLGQVSAQTPTALQTKKSHSGQFDLSDGFPEVEKTKTTSGSEFDGTKTSSHEEQETGDVAGEIPEGLDVPTSLREAAQLSRKTGSAEDDFNELLGLKEQKAKKTPANENPQTDVAAVAKKATEMRPQTLPTPRKAPPAAGPATVAPQAQGPQAPTSSSQAPTSSPQPAPPQPPLDEAPGLLSLTPVVKGLLAHPPEGYSLLLVAVKAGNSLRLVGWPETHPAEKNLSQLEADFSLATPSPFRICLRTEKPYHGYLINSPFLDQFMKSWNEGKYPETLTVVPLLADQHVSGFVIAFGNAEVANKAGLAAVERLTQDLLHKLPHAPQKKAS